MQDAPRGQFHSNISIPVRTGPMTGEQRKILFYFFALSSKINKTEWKPPSQDMPTSSLYGGSYKAPLC